MQKIVTVIGTRPQIIKSALVSHELRATGGVEEVIVNTGQHYDFNLYGQFLQEFGIEDPKYNLGVGSGGHAQQVGSMLLGLEPILTQECPNHVLVYGDTNSTLAGALTAAKLNIPVIHIESGLRSFQNSMPEEINRKLTDHVCSLLCAPTDQAVRNLRVENIAGDSVVYTGDVLYDMLAFHLPRVPDNSLSRFSLKDGDYILATIHRAENTNVEKRLRAIIEALGMLARDLPVILPLHPRTAKMLEIAKINVAPSILVVEPQSFGDMLNLERHAAMLVTDSGGVQREAYFFKKPCVVVRNCSEWVELVQDGWSCLTASDSAEEILRTCRSMLATFNPEVLPYGAPLGAVSRTVAAIVQR